MERCTSPKGGTTDPAYLTLHDVAAWLLTSGNPPEPSGEIIIRVAEDAYVHLRERLAVSLGALGFDALWSRAIHLALRHAPIGDSAKATTALSSGPPGLRELVRDDDPAAILELLQAVLTSFFTLLVTFIGEPLTVRIIRQLWPTLPTNAAAPNAKEDDHD